MNDDRIAREQKFHDQRFADDPRVKLSRIYQSCKSSTRAYEKVIQHHEGTERALEYGCGTGGPSFRLAKSGTIVDAIDISAVAIRIMEERADVEGVSDKMNCQVMNAEELDFPDDTFDLIYGTGILHHLDLDKSLTEISRVLKPGGVAVFREPLDHHPAVRLFRALTPTIRSVDEHPLTRKDLKDFESYFRVVQISYHHLISPVSALFFNTPLFRPVMHVTEAIDRFFFRIPFLRGWAWQVVLRFVK